MSHQYIEHVLKLYSSNTYFCVFDLETTDKLDGVHPKGVAHPAGTPTGKTMQLAAQRYYWDHERRRAELIGQINLLIDDPDIKPGPGLRGDEPDTGGAGCCLNLKAFQTHHIRIADLRSRGVSPLKAWQQFARLANEAVLVGQNIIDFDIPFANRDLKRLGFSKSFVLDERKAIDTLVIARHLWDLKSYRLRALANFLGVRTDPALDHDALGDINTTWNVWLALLQPLNTYHARFIAGKPNQYKRVLGTLGSAWTLARGDR